MSWSFINASTFTRSSLSDPLEANLPTYAEGDLLLLYVATYTPSETIDVPPTGYTLLAQDDLGSVTGGLYIYGKIATASESAPSVDRSGTSDLNLGMASFRDSNGALAIGSIVDAYNAADVSNNTNDVINYPSLTVANDNSLVILAGRRGKQLNEATTIDTVSGFTQIKTYRASATYRNLNVWDYQIQTSKANITAGVWTLTNNTETASTPERGIALALIANSASFNPAWARNSNQIIGM